MRLKNLPIAYKFLFIFGLIAVFLGSLSAYVHYQFESRTLMAESNLENRLVQRIILRYIQLHLQEGLPFNKAAVGAVDAPGLPVAVLLAEVTGRNGVIASSTQKDKIGRFSTDRKEIREVIKSEKPKTFLFVLPAHKASALVDKTKISRLDPFDQRHKVQGLITPVKFRGKVVGAIHTYLSLQRLEADLNRSIFITVVSGAVLAIIGVLFLMVLIYYFIQRPLIDLTNTARRISGGDLALRAAVGSEDEIGQLAQSFNDMTDALIHTGYRADTDGLTGLYNYRHFMRAIEREVELSCRYDRQFSFAILDLDFFKDVNDTLGHQRGDEVLINVANFLRRSVRAVDYVARYGGEEFAIIMPETSSGEAVRLCERLRTNLPKEVKIEPYGEKGVYTSVGVADFPQCAQDKEGIIAAADAALLFAKRSGRN